MSSLEAAFKRGTARQAGREMRKTTTKPTKKTETIPYDVGEQLRTPEEMAAYLDAWLVEAPDDAAGIARALGDIARAKGMSQVARKAGLSRESLYKALSEGAHPPYETINAVLHALGVKFTVVSSHPGPRRRHGITPDHR